MLLAHHYCVQCGAANTSERKICFACGVSLKATRPLLSTYATTSVSGQLAERQMLKGRYRILAQVGEGGFATVYLAEDTHEHGHLVALKEISLAGLNSREVIDATDTFNREVELLSSLKHPGIPRFHEHITDEQNWYLIMDFIDGETLEDYLDSTPGGKLPLEQVLAIGIQLCAVLDYLHMRQPPVIYRDLKPGNVMITKDAKLCLIDFGTARRYDARKFKDTIAFGSPGFAAPEQYGRAQTTARSDIYSLGALLHHLLTGNDPAITPFHFEPLSTEKQEVKALDALLTRMLEMDMSKRPATIKEVNHELQLLSASLSAHSQLPLLIKAKTPAQEENPYILPHIIPSFSTMGVTVYIYRGHANTVRALSWSPDSTHIASASKNVVQVWEALTGKNVFTYHNHSGAVNVLSWSSNGKLLASAGDDHTVHVWDALSRPRLLRSFSMRLGFFFTNYEGHAERVTTLAWSPDSKMIASAGKDHEIHIWKPGARKATYTFRDQKDETRVLAWSPDKRYFASGGADSIVRIYDLTSESLKLIYRKKSASIYALAWAPDGTRIALSGKSRSIEIWDIGTIRQTSVIRAHQRKIYALSWSPDGNHLASASKDGTVRIWRVLHQQQVYLYDSHEGEVRCLSWSPNGKYIASAAQETIHIWKAQ